MCAATRGIFFRPPGSLFWLLICLATSERPPISGLLFRVGRGLESVGTAKLFCRFGGIFPGKTWGKHLLQRPPTGAKFRQLRLFPYHLKSAGVKSIPVRVRSAAPRRKKAAPFRFRGLRKSRENSISAESFFLSESDPLALGSDSVGRGGSYRSSQAPSSCEALNPDAESSVFAFRVRARQRI